jgi:O-methyltransferase
VKGSNSLVRRVRVIPWLRKAFVFGGFRYVPIPIMRFPTFDPEMNRSLGWTGDYVRYGTIALALRRIDMEEIQGSIAEVGVYKGDTSQVIHTLSPQRILYLFDTFDGFPNQHLESEGMDDDRFSDTSSEAVLQRIGTSTNIVIKKGIVPDTFHTISRDERFSFVLLDLDLYYPTIKSFEFFYDRLVSGAYLIVHDYNSTESNYACKKAVSEFMQDKPEHLLEIPDEWGSVLFRKL